MLAYNFRLIQDGHRFSYNVFWVIFLVGSILLWEFSYKAVVEHVDLSEGVHGSFAAANYLYIVFGLGGSICGCVASCQNSGASGVDLYEPFITVMPNTTHNEIRLRNKLK
jgi:hypothetical protein